MKNKVTIEEPGKIREPEWEVGCLYLCTGNVFLATMYNNLINLGTGKIWHEGRRFGTHGDGFRRLPPGTKVTITVGGEE